MTTKPSPLNGFGRYALECVWTALSLALGVSPLILLLTHLPEMSAAYAYIPLAGLTLGLAGALLPSRVRLLCAMLGAAASLALGALAMLSTGLIACIGLGIVGAACALVLPTFRNGGLPSTFSMVLAVLHALMPLGARLAGAASPPLFPFACAYLIVFLINTNSQSLRAQCSSHQQRPAQSMRLGNTVLTVVLFALCLLVSQFGALREAFETLAQDIVVLILRIIAALVPDQAEVSGGEGGGVGGSELGGLPAGETAAIWIMLERVGFVIAIIAIIALVVWLATRIYKLAKIVARYIREIMGRYAQSLKADYVDQTEDLSGWGEIGKTLQDKASGWAARLKPIHWESLDNRERIRAAYTAVLRREKKPDASRTARETLLSGANTGKCDAQALCDSYERARYSEHPITDAEAENARRAL